MKKKGFTLIELLAVIVILAIIALIAVPSVLNIIEDSKKGAAEASARNIVSAAKTYYMSQSMKNESVTSIDLSKETLKYDGEQASKGSITFIDGKPAAKLYISGYCVEVDIASNITSEKTVEEDCDVEIAEATQKLLFPVSNGQEVYFNPNTGLACSKIEVETNVNNYKSTHTITAYDLNAGKNKDFPTITGLNSGCMKWYAFLDSEDSSTVNLLLDHNTTGYVAWDATGAGKAQTVKEQLQIDISDWNSDVKNTARFITAPELNQIAPTDGSIVWNEDNYATWYYLHTGNSTEYKGTVGSNKYAWLFDNTYQCEEYGCNINDIGTSGYWTLNYTKTGDAWTVLRNGHFHNQPYLSFNIYGVRPVIEVSKSIFE